jgi:hypothetical protein
MKHNTTKYSATIENPENGETIEIIGISEEDIENQMSNLFDYGLDENGTYVGEEADA